MDKPKYYVSRVRTPTYRSWESMKSRCKGTGGRKNNKWYLDKGITYDPDWETFANFLRDMGERPEGCTLDRIDNSKGYSKENCRWATASQQSKNRFHKLSKSGQRHIYTHPQTGWHTFEIKKKVRKYFKRLEDAIKFRDDYLSKELL